MLDLGAMYSQQPSKKKANKPPPSKPLQLAEKKPRQKICLKLTEQVEFSVTDFEKINKGLTNTRQVNCFMNVCLQSLFSCPGFFNLMQALAGDSQLAEQMKLNDGLVWKLMQVQKHMDSKWQLDQPFSRGVIDGETIFQEFLRGYNPDNEQ